MANVFNATNNIGISMTTRSFLGHGITMYRFMNKVFYKLNIKDNNNCRSILLAKMLGLLI